MHRREVELIASVIRERREAYVGIGTMSEANRISCQATEAIAKDMCRKLKTENPSFRDDLFIRACGIPS